MTTRSLFAVAQQRPDVEPVAAVHVRGAADLDAVEGDLGDGVQAVADQVDALVVARPVDERGR